MVNGDNLQMQTSCSPRIKKSNTTPSLQTQLILSTVIYSFMLCITSVVSKNLLIFIRMRHVYGKDDVLYICKLCNTCDVTCVTCDDVTCVTCLPS